MPYQSTKPLSTDQLNQSQADLAGNFTALNTFLTVNHNAFAAVDGEGKHKFITLPQQTVVPAVNPPATSATEFGIYNKTNGTAPAVFVRKPSKAAGVITDDIDITTMYLNGGPIPAANEYSINLPSGLIIKGGYVPVMPGADHIIITYHVAFPNDTLNIQLTYAENGGGTHDIYATYVDETNFNLRAHHGLSVYWQTIGY